MIHSVMISVPEQALGMASHYYWLSKMDALSFHDMARMTDSMHGTCVHFLRLGNPSELLSSMVE